MPDANEWDTSRLPECRRAYLDSGRSFEDIASSIVSEAEIRKGCIEPCQDRPPAPKKARRICFRVGICQKTYDLFYNAPDGLRGRYWQGPDIGFLATRHLIDLLKPKLMRFVENNPMPEPRKCPAMTLRDIEDSLDAPSAKVWVRERDDDRNSLINTKAEQR